MFSLDIPAEPYWLDLPFGVRVFVRPLNGMVVAAAQNAALAAASAIQRARQDAIDTGMPVPPDLPDLTDDALRDAFARVETARGLGRYGIMAWEGVGNAAGTAEEPFSRAGAERLATHPQIMEAFLLAYHMPVGRVDAEGNASAPTPCGSTAAGATIAADAHPSAPTAQEPPRLH